MKPDEKHDKENDRNAKKVETQKTSTTTDVNENPTTKNSDTEKNNI